MTISFKRIKHLNNLFEFFFEEKVYLKLKKFSRKKRRKRKKKKNINKNNIN